MRIATLLVIALVLTACDPGFSYAPAGWEPVSDFEWRLQLPDLQLKMLQPGELIGSETLIPEFTASNLTDETLVFEAVSLSSKGRTYEGQFSGHPDPQWRTVPPQASKRIVPFIELGKPLYEALGPEMNLDLSYRLGSRPPQSLSIHFQRR